MSKKALGKGLSALLSADLDDTIEASSTQILNNQGQVVSVRLDQIKASNLQPRNYFDESKIDELAESIKANGLLQPILVRKDAYSDSYEIIAGERRYRAAKKAGLEQVPVMVKNIDDRETLKLALIENIQRENLTPIEEAEGYKNLQSEFGYTQEQLSNIIGKSRSHIANMLRLLNLPSSIKDKLNSGAITMGHARVLVNAENPEELAEKIIADNINVRDAEKYATGAGLGGSKKKSKNTGSKKTPKHTKDEDLIAIEESLASTTGLKVKIEESEDGGRVILFFNNLSELDKILQKLN